MLQSSLVALRTVAASLALALALAALPASAQQSAHLSDADRAELARIETYLNGITTLRARFTQINETEGFATGTFSLSRPGRMRLEYDPPVPYLYVADGTWLTFWDGQLEQRSDVLLGSTVADLFVRRDIDFGGALTVAAMRPAADEIIVDVVQSDDPHAGMISLVFDREPLALTRWQTIDAQGMVTEVSLHNVERGMALPGSLFSAPRPPLGSNR